VIEARHEIEALVGFEGREPGSDAERRAAEHLVERLDGLGRKAETEQIDVWPNWPATYALHTALAILGSVLSVSVPVLGAALALIATVLTFLDANGTVITTRRLLGRRASQNVLSPEDGEKGGRVVLVAHYDAGRGGLAFASRLQERRAALGQTLRRPIGPLEPLFWAMVWVLVCCLVRLPGIESFILTVIQFVGTVVLILALPLLLDTAFARPSPGANDNASGVATVLRLAERYGGELEYFDLHVLLTGSQEALALGMRAHLKRRRGELDPERVVFLNVDEVGRGTVRFTEREGLILALETHKQLVDLCEEIVEDQEESDEDQQESDEDQQESDEDQEESGDDQEESGEDQEEGQKDADRPGARGMISRTTSDAFAARGAGFPAITITCKGRLDYTPGHHSPSDTPDRIDDEALERAYGFCCELIERLDATIGPDLEKTVEETHLKEDS
jgi:hypothetical protein